MAKRWNGGSPYRGSSDKQRRAHVIVATRALGHDLPPGAEIHHVDGNKSNNAPTNLVICDSGAYHALLHVRAKTKSHGGDPNTQKYCADCNSVKLLTEFTVWSQDKATGRHAICAVCSRKRCADRRAMLRDKRTSQ